MKASKILNSYNAVSALICQLVVFVSSLLLLLTIGRLPPQIPLWYSRVWGPQRLANPAFLWLVPLLSISILILNWALAKNLESTILKRLLFWSVPIFGIIASYALVKIIFLVL